MTNSSIKISILFILMVFSASVFSQEYDSVVIENQLIDENNVIYKPGNVFIYDYEIILNERKFKLRHNSGMFLNRKFELIPIISDSIGVDKIHLFVTSVSDSERTNENQTQISYVQEPVFDAIISTGVVENHLNVWLHPFRRGFFNSLQTAPFPYVKRPIEIGLRWTDRMNIGQGWRNEIWGEWEGELLLTYEYEIIGKESVNTHLGNLECYVIESVAKSNIGKTKLVSYFSEEFGFVRLEYELLNNLLITMWLTQSRTGVEFNDTMTFFRTKEYIKSQVDDK